jgi:integrase
MLPLRAWILAEAETAAVDADHAPSLIEHWPSTGAARDEDARLIVRVRDTRVVVLAFAPRNALAYHGERTTWVFHHDIDRRHAKAGERIASLRRAFAGAVERAELPSDLNQHDLRHRRVTTWLAEGKPAHIVQKAMGHSDLRTTLHYEHLVDEDLLQLVAAPREASTA